MKDRRADSFAFIFAVMDPAVLREARMEPARQVLSALTAVQPYAASSRPVYEWHFTPFAQESAFPTVLNGSMLLQIALARKERAPKSIFHQ